MTQADGMTRCYCGRMLAEVGTILDRHWLHVEEPPAAHAADSAEALLREALQSHFAENLSPREHDDIIRLVKGAYAGAQEAVARNAALAAPQTPQPADPIREHFEEWGVHMCDSEHLGAAAEGPEPL
jgi:hypothetical protein